MEIEEVKTNLLFVFRTRLTDIRIQIDKDDYEDRYEAILLAVKAFWIQVKEVQKWDEPHEKGVIEEISIMEIPDVTPREDIEQEYKEL